MLFDYSAQPITAWFTVNRNCNFRCKWCYAEPTGYELDDNMSLQLAKELAKICANMGIKSITLIGGEPTLWPYLFEFNDFCRSLEIKTNMVTNAYMFSDNKFLDNLLKHPSDTINISVKALSKDKLEQTTGVKNISKVKRGIKKAIEMYKVGVNVVYNNLIDTSDILDIANKCRLMGARSFTVGYCIPIIHEGEMRADQSFMIDPMIFVNNIVEIFPTLEKMYNNKAFVDTRLPFCIWPKDFISMMVNKNYTTNICHVHRRNGLVFDIDGNILPCNGMVGCHIAQHGNDFHDSDSLLTHLNSKPIKRIYRELLRYPLKKCVGCHWEKECHGGCIVNWAVMDHELCNKYSHGKEVIL